MQTLRARVGPEVRPVGNCVVRAACGIDGTPGTISGTFCDRLMYKQWHICCREYEYNRSKECAS